jgi:hypothetical protein
MSFRLFESLLVFPKKLQQSTVHLLCLCPSTVTRVQENRRLPLPGSTAERISVDKDNGLTGAVVLVVEVDVAGVFLPDSKVRH